MRRSLTGGNEATAIHHTLFKRPDLQPWLSDHQIWTETAEQGHFGMRTKSARILTSQPTRPAS